MRYIWLLVWFVIAVAAESIESVALSLLLWVLDLIPAISIITIYRNTKIVIANKDDVIEIYPYRLTQCVVYNGEVVSRQLRIMRRATTHDFVVEENGQNIRYTIVVSPPEPLSFRFRVSIQMNGETVFKN